MPIIGYTRTSTDGTDTAEIFDSDKAERFIGACIPVDPSTPTATKEDLYLLSTGEWVINRIVLAQTHTSTYQTITPQEAHTWLKEHRYPEAAARYFERPRGGRPAIGKERLNTKVPARTHNQIAELSEMYAEDMTDTVRRLLDEALAHRETIGAPGSPRGRYDI